MKNYFYFNEDNEDEEMSVAFWLHMVNISSIMPESKQHGGSRPGKKGNIDRDYAGAHTHYMKKYFWPTCLVRPNLNLSSLVGRSRLVY